MNFRKVLLFVLIIVSYNSYAQKCSCEDNFYWLKKTFEENDAGFQYVIDKKGAVEYKNHSDFFIKKVKKIKDLSECREVLFDWLLFFRPSHLSLSINQENIKKPDSKTNSVAKPNWEKVEIKEDELKNYLAKVAQPSFEGIWVSGAYTIGVIKKNNDYIGYILDSKGTNWKQYQVKFRIKDNLDKTYSAVYYMGDYSAQKFNEVKLIGYNFLNIGFISLKRIFPDNLIDNQLISDYVESQTAQKPYFKEISDKTVLLRIPTFHYSHKKDIDSILSANKKLILSKENLIIDLRNNGGGSDASFKE